MELKEMSNEEFRQLKREIQEESQNRRIKIEEERHEEMKLNIGKFFKNKNGQEYFKIINVVNNISFYTDYTYQIFSVCSNPDLGYISAGTDTCSTGDISEEWIEIKEDEYVTKVNEILKKIDMKLNIDFKG